MYIRMEQDYINDVDLDLWSLQEEDDVIAIYKNGPYLYCIREHDDPTLVRRFVYTNETWEEITELEKEFLANIYTTYDEEDAFNFGYMRWDESELLANSI